MRFIYLFKLCFMRFNYVYLVPHPARPPLGAGEKEKQTTHTHTPIPCSPIPVVFEDYRAM